MFDLPKSLASTSWAVSAFGVQQFANLLGPGGAARAAAAYYPVTSAVQQQFSASPVFYAIDQLGGGFQRGAVDAFWDVLQLKPLDPQWLGRSGGRVLRAAVDAAVALTPAENLEATWNQLRNTFAVISLVNRAPAALNLSPGPLHLTEGVARAYALGGDYEALWLIEGLGEEFANRNWSPTRPPRGLLTSGQAADLPDKSLLMMHAGMGIAFARHTVRALSPYSPDAQVAAALQNFIGLVAANARRGYEGPALESLGLVTRTWYPRMVALIDRRLWTLDTAALEYFWHGVGRASYFTPQYLLPGASAFQGVADIAPHRLALLNGTAGAAWAFTLVNLRQPQVILNLLKLHGHRLAESGAFSNGVASTLMMALDVIPADPFAAALAAYRPDTANSELADLWRRLVHLPCRRAIDYYYPLLKRSGSLGIFRYQDLECRAQSLEGGG